MVKESLSFKVSSFSISYFTRGFVTNMNENRLIYSHYFQSGWTGWFMQQRGCVDVNTCYDQIRFLCIYEIRYQCITSS